MQFNILSVLKLFYRIITKGIALFIISNNYAQAQVV